MFDSVRFLEENFNNADGIVGLLHAYRLDAPQRDTARKWFERGDIPAKWLPLLICVLEIDSGEPVRLAQYLNPGGPNADATRA